MAIEKQEINESSIGFNLISEKRRHNKTHDDKPYLVDSLTLNSWASQPSTDEIIIIDDDEEKEVTLEPKRKKPRLGFWWDNVEAVDELCCVVKGSPPKAKEDNGVASKADSYFSSTDLHETMENKKINEDKRSLPEKDKDESTVGESNKNKGYEHVTLEDLGVSVEDLKSVPWEAFEFDSTWEIRSDPWYGGYMEDLSLFDFNSHT
ncbi:hypothetical protein AtEden1_Chr1g0074401 [Arabidopsis thaliana]